MASNKIPFTNFLQEFEKMTLSFSADEITYSLPIKRIIEFLTSPDTYYHEICSNPTIKEIDGIPKSHFLYGISKFYISDNYDVPEILSTRLTRLQNNIDYDIEAINKLTKPNTKSLEQATINPTLLEEILKDLPNNYTDLQKAIYVYLKMCDIFSYDEEFFATNESGNTAKKHSDIHNVSTITSSNNAIVCYEFTAIYAKILELFNINYEFISYSFKKYGAGHTYLLFRVDKFLIEADAVTPLFKSDMYYIKAGIAPKKIICQNENQQTKREFYNTLNKVWQDYLAKNPKNNEFANLVDTYKQLHELQIPLPSLDERISMFYQKISSSTLIGIDRLSYILDLYRTIFTENEKISNFTISIIRNKHPEDYNKEASPEVIIAYNPQDFYENLNSNQYFILKSDNSLIPVTKQYLMSKFYSEPYSYTESTDHFVPGL